MSVDSSSDIFRSSHDEVTYSKQHRLVLSKEEEELKRKNEDLSHTITHGSRKLLVDRITDYFRLYCRVNDKKFQWKDLELLFDQPISLNLKSNKYEDDVRKSMEKLDKLLRNFKFFPRRWSSVAKHFFEIHPNETVNLDTFRKAILKFSNPDEEEEENEDTKWNKQEVTFLFNHILSGPYGYSSESPDLDEEMPEAFDGFTFKLAYKMHLCTIKKRKVLNNVAEVIQKLSEFAGNKAVILRYLKNTIGVTPVKSADDASLNEIESAFNILIADYTMHMAEGTRLKESVWWEEKADGLINSDLISIVTDLSPTSLSSSTIGTAGPRSRISSPGTQMPPISPMSKSRGGGSMNRDLDSFSRISTAASTNSQSSHITGLGTTFTREYRRIKTAKMQTKSISAVKRALAQKMREDKDIYSLSRNKSLLMPLTAEELQEKRMRKNERENSRKTTDLGIQGPNLKQIEEEKRKIRWEGERKKEEAFYAEQKRQKARATRHVMLNMHKYQNIVLNDMQAITGPDDYILLKHNNRSPGDMPHSARDKLLSSSGIQPLNRNNTANPDLPQINTGLCLQTAAYNASRGGSAEGPAANYLKKIAEGDTANTEQQQKYYHSIIKKFDHSLGLTLRRMTQLRGEDSPDS